MANKSLARIAAFWPALLFCALGFLVYANTFHVSPRFDDSIFIFDKIQIRDLSRVWSEGELYRKIPYLTFALNYRWTGPDVWSWHLVNLLLHITTTCFVYGIARTAWRSPSLKGSPLAASGDRLAILSALLFLAHPIQTSAVTYIYQRTIVIATLFHSMAVYGYLRGRIDGSLRHWALCAAAAVLAVFTKQINMTLPMTLLLTEVAFCSVSLRGFIRRGVLFAPLAVLPGALYIWLMKIDLTKFSLDTLRHLYPHNLNSGFGWNEWVLTQINVMRTYLRLMVFPMNQMLDYDYPMSRSWTEPSVLLSGALLAAVLLTAVLCWKRVRVYAWGVFFMAFVLLLEFFAIRDTIFEHRLYLPMIGFALAAPAAVFAVIGSPRRATAVFAALLLTLSAAAYARNAVWADEEKFWKEGIRLAPQRGRPYYSLGVYYAMIGRHDLAVPMYRKAIEIWPHYADAYSNLGKSLEETGHMDQAIYFYAKALQLDPTLPEALNNYGSALVRSGRQAEARDVYKEAMRRRPDNYEAMSNMGSTYAQLGDFDEAEKWYRLALQTNPLHAPAHSNLASIRSRHGDFDGAIESCLEAVRLDPDFFEARYNLALLYVMRKDWENAELQYRETVRIRPKFAEGHNNLGTFAAQKGEYRTAERSFRKALDLNPDYTDAWINLANLFKTEGRLADARKIALHVTERWPDSARARRTLEALDGLDADPST